MERDFHETMEVMPHDDVKRQIAVAAFVSVMLVVPVLWMLMDRTPPYTFERVEISPHDVVQGSDIEITFTVKQGRPACGPGVVYREFKEASGKLHIYDPIQRAETPDLNNNNKITRTSKLPDHISPGPTFYRGTACYSCNPLHSWLHWPVCISTPNVEFNVVRKPLS